MNKDFHYEEFVNELDELQMLNVKMVAISGNIVDAGGGTKDSKTRNLIDSAVKKINSIKEKYGSFGFEIDGFSLNFGIPPSVSLSFKFTE